MSTNMSVPDQANLVCEEYKIALSDLTFNSKPLINMLTMLAEENAQYSEYIVNVIKDQFYKANPKLKLPHLYLIDSIIKNVNEPYLARFSAIIVPLFCHIFEQVDEKVRLALYKLRQTWPNVLPNSLLYDLDIHIKKLDPAWPITAKVPAQSYVLPESSDAVVPISVTSPTNTIHVNPKFFAKKTPENVTTSTDALAKTSSDETKDLTQKEEQLYKQILMAKQKQLLQLQQQKLEAEIAQTRLKLHLQQNHQKTEGSSSNAIKLEDPRLLRRKEMPKDSIQDNNIHNNEKLMMMNNKNGSTLKRLSDTDERNRLNATRDQKSFQEGSNLTTVTDSKRMKKMSSHDISSPTDLTIVEDIDYRQLTAEQPINKSLIKRSQKDFTETKLPILPGDKDERLRSNQRNASPSLLKPYISNDNRNDISKISPPNIDKCMHELIQQANTLGNHGHLNAEKQASILKTAANLLESGRLNPSQHKTLLRQLQNIFDVTNNTTSHIYNNEIFKDHKGGKHETIHSINRKPYISPPLTRGGFRKFNSHAYKIPKKTTPDIRIQNKFHDDFHDNVLSHAETVPISAPITIIYPKPIDEIEYVMIDGQERAIHFHGTTGLIFLLEEQSFQYRQQLQETDQQMAQNIGLPHVIAFKLESDRTKKNSYRTIVVGDVREKLYKDAPTVIYLNGKRHTFRLGAPSKELFIDGQPYQMQFSTNPVPDMVIDNNMAINNSNTIEQTNVLIDGKAHRIQLVGPAPEVDIEETPYYNIDDDFIRDNNTKKIDEYLHNIQCRHCRRYIDTYVEWCQKKLPQNNANIVSNTLFSMPKNPNLTFPLSDSNYMLSYPSSTPLSFPSAGPMLFNNILASAQTNTATFGNNATRMMGMTPSFGNSGSFDARNPIMHTLPTSYPYYDTSSSKGPHETNRFLPPAIPMMPTLPPPINIPGLPPLPTPVISAVMQSSIPFSKVETKMPTSTSNVNSSGDNPTTPVIDVNQILANLVQSGVLASLGASESGDIPDIKTQNIKPDSISETNEIPMPELEITNVQGLKIKYESVIDSLYAGFQCSSCGLRFTSQTDTSEQILEAASSGGGGGRASQNRYGAHLDWHFRQNRKRLAQSKLTGLSKKSYSHLNGRSWYYTVEEWCDLEEIGDQIDEPIQQSTLSTESKNPFFSTNAKNRTNVLSDASMSDIFRPSDKSHYNEYQAKDAFKILLNQLQNTQNDENEHITEESLAEKFEKFPIAGELDICTVCGEKFEQNWDEDREEWILEDAIREIKSQKLFHPSCWQDETSNISIDNRFDTDAGDENLIKENSVSFKTDAGFIDPQMSLLSSESRSYQNSLKLKEEYGETKSEPFTQSSKDNINNTISCDQNSIVIKKENLYNDD